MIKEIFERAADMAKTRKDPDQYEFWPNLSKVYKVRSLSISDEAYQRLVYLTQAHEGEITPREWLESNIGLEFYCETGLPPDSRDAEEEIQTYYMLKKRRKEHR